MLLVCPSCRTRYVVPDSAIGANGRQVRCASCRHSWFQEGPASVAPPKLEPVLSPPASAYAEATPAVAETVPEPAPAFAGFESPPPPPPMVEKAPVVVPPPPVQEFEERSQFAHEPPFRPRRNPAKIMTYAAVAFAILVAAGGGALWYSGWLDNVFSVAGKEPDLEIVLHDNLEPRDDRNGTKYFIASGSIVNPTAQRQNVPDMLVTLTDASGRAVYNWTIKAPVRQLAPGGKVDFSSLQRDVHPASAKIFINWAL
jgi:predicted Zn finger-like uncharacterized protein